MYILNGKTLQNYISGFMLNWNEKSEIWKFPISGTVNDEGHIMHTKQKLT